MQHATVLAASLMLSTGVAQAVTTSYGFDGYNVSLSYVDGATFGDLSSWGGGGNTVFFSWNIPTTVSVSSTGALAEASYALPSITVTSDAGYKLGSFALSFGNLSTASLDGAELDATVTGASTLGAFTVTGSYTPILTGPFNLGFLAGSGPIGNGGSGLTTMQISAAELTLAASGANAAVYSQGQSNITISLVLTPVPEPETYALFGAGLAALGLLALRRRV